MILDEPLNLHLVGEHLGTESLQVIVAGKVRASTPSSFPG
jgi:hypothetical protein